MTNFADVAFGIGENYSFMWGAGVLTGGERKRLWIMIITTIQSQEQLSWGTFLFFVLGHHGFGFETLLGYRMNFIKAEFEDQNSSIYMGKTLIKT